MTIQKIKNGISYELNGWKYISIKGNARERGFAYGYLIANDFKKIQKMLEFVSWNNYGRTWLYFIDSSTRDTYPKVSA